MGEEADADWQAGLVECGEETVMPKMAKLRVQAQHLQPGDIVGSGEKVVNIGRGIGTPASKVDVWVEKDGKTRYTLWGKYTLINIKRAEQQ